MTAHSTQEHAVDAEDGGRAADDPAEGLEPPDPLETGEPGPLDGPDDPLHGLGTAEDPVAAPEPAWPETEEESGTGTGDETGAVQQPGTGTGSSKAARPWAADR